MATDNFTIKVRGLDRLAKKLSPKEMGDAVYKGLDAWAIYLQGELGTYPPKDTKTREEAYGKAFFTPKQQRGFFARLNAGAIRVPYRRTRTLGDAWDIKRPSSDTRMVVNATSYATFVQGRRQSRYHEGNWPFFGDVADDTRAKGLDLIQNQVRKALDG